jgi:hypothetical protein
VTRHHSGESSAVAGKLRTLLHTAVADGVDYRRYFETADTECNGYVSSRAFRSALKQLGAQDSTSSSTSSSSGALSKQDVEMLEHRFAAASDDRHHGQQVNTHTPHTCCLPEVANHIVYTCVIVMYTNINQ